MNAPVRTPRLLVVAHNIRSLQNVGALFRSCDGAGVSKLILSGYTGAPPRAKISKVALGAEDAVPWAEARSDAELDAILDGHFTIVLEQSVDSQPPAAIELPPGQDVALVCCEELYGADAAMLARADALLELPMRGSKESLNVAVAAAVAAYGLADQLWGTTAADLCSRQTRPPVREGVLTHGVTTGQVPGQPRTS